MSFGKISTQKDDVAEESFVFADKEYEDDDDEIEIIKYSHLESRKWLLENKSSVSPQSSHCGDHNDWLIQADTDGCVDVDSSCNIVEKSEWLISNKDVSSSPIVFEDLRIEESSPRESLHSFLVRDDSDVELTSFLHPSSHQCNRQVYTYPKRSFLEHWDFMASQDASVYLITKDDDVNQSTKSSDDERCQWLYRPKEDCQQNENCSSEKGCDLFNKNWLLTANDW